MASLIKSVAFTTVMTGKMANVPARTAKMASGRTVKEANGKPLTDRAGKDRAARGKITTGKVMTGKRGAPGGSGLTPSALMPNPIVRSVIKTVTLPNGMVKNGTLKTGTAKRELRRIETMPSGLGKSVSSSKTAPTASRTGARRRCGRMRGGIRADAVNANSAPKTLLVTSPGQLSSPRNRRGCPRS